MAIDEFINTLRKIYTPSKFLLNIAHRHIVKKKINSKVGGQRAWTSLKTHSE